MKVYIKRVSYGRKETPEELKEYHLFGVKDCPIGTKKEILKFFKSKGIEVELEEIK